MGKGGGGTQTTVQQQKIPEWVEAAGQENLRIANEIAARPYVNYPGNLTATFTPEQEAAFNLAQSSVGMTAPLYGMAGQAIGGVSQYAPIDVTAPSFLQANVSQYMNPYTENVINRASEAAMRQLQMQQNQIASQAARAGAFGGSRQGIQEGVAAAETARGIGDLTAQLQAQSYGQAQQAIAADQARAQQAALANQAAGLQAAGLRLQGGQGLANLGGLAQRAALTDVATMGAVGQARQDLAQRQLDEAYARFQEERNYPVQALNLRLAALGALPYGKETTQTTSGMPTGNSFLAGLGGVGGLFSGIAALAGLSDETAKTDIKKIGTDKETGLNIYSYRYKGDPKTYPKMVGPMAKEVEKKYPDQVTTVAGKKVVNSSFLSKMGVG